MAYSVPEFNQIPEVDINLIASGIKIESPRLFTPRIIPFDVKGKCALCKSDNAKLDFLICSEGVTVMCNRLKHPKFVPFDYKYPLPSFCVFRLKTRSKVFNIPHGSPYKIDIIDEAMNEAGIKDEKNSGASETTNGEKLQ